MGGVAYVRRKADLAVVRARFASSLRGASIHLSVYWNTTLTASVKLLVCPGLLSR